MSAIAPKADLQVAPAPAATVSLSSWIAVLASMIGAFMAILNIQITKCSLLDIEGGIGTGVDNGAWISTSYLIGEIIVIPMTAYLSLRGQTVNSDRKRQRETGGSHSRFP